MSELARRIAGLSPEQRDRLLRQLNGKPEESGPEEMRAEARRTGTFPLSYAQQRLWFLHRVEPDSAAYNFSLVIRLEGVLDVAALERALEEIVRRHAVLRTNFRDVSGQPVQIVAPPAPLSVPFFDLRGAPDAAHEAQIQSHLDELTRRPFDLAGEPLTRMRLLRPADDVHLLLFVTHHILFDGWSVSIFIRELSALYVAFRDGTASPLPEMRFQYVDYAVWQREWLRGEVLENLLDYWKTQLKDAPPVLELPGAMPRPERQAFRGANHVSRVSRELVEQLKALGQREGATLFMTLLAAFKVLLYRYTKAADLVIGTDVANRNRVETEDLLGFFVNLLPVRTELSGGATFRETLRRVRGNAIQTYAHQELPFEKLVEALRPARLPNYNPLVQVLFILQNTPTPAGDVAGVRISLQGVDNGSSKFDLVLSISVRETGLMAYWNYNADLYERMLVEQLARDFDAVLRGVAANPDVVINDIRVAGVAARPGEAAAARQASPISRLKGVKRRNINLTEVELVSASSLRPGETLPLVLQPGVDNLDMVEWGRENRADIESRLLKHGAILFRGFQVTTIPAFEQFALAVSREMFGEYGDLPRAQEGVNVYQATPYPSNKTILFHNESSHLDRWPLKQWFFCVKAAAQGGETPLVDSRKIYRLLDPAIIERFTAKKLLYVRNFTGGLDVSWQDFFKTTDRAAVEDHCRKASIECEWTRGGGLRTRRVCPAVSRHPVTGESVFFNQIQLHHVACLDREMRQSLLTSFDVDDLPRNVYYGDGTPIEDSVVEEITQTYWGAAVTFPWQEGDILLLDNMLTAHARNPYLGERKIVVAMGEMTTASD
ncbi:MAG TPA: condensation domain-containing protein [Pyrinomonadaceae bacterium]|nr:condensation domain-containing protein [Pyrinomonadaceae bacterium]